MLNPHSVMNKMDEPLHILRFCSRIWTEAVGYHLVGFETKGFIKIIFDKRAILKKGDI